MQNIFHHSSSGRTAFTGPLKSREVHRAITLHPIKEHAHMYRLNNFLQVSSHLRLDKIIIWKTWSITQSYSFRACPYGRKSTTVSKYEGKWLIQLSNFVNASVRRGSSRRTRANLNLWVKENLLRKQTVNLIPVSHFYLHFAALQVWRQV